MKTKLQIIMVTALMLTVALGTVFAGKHTNAKSISLQDNTHKNVAVDVAGFTLAFPINIKYGYYGANGDYSVVNFYMPPSVFYTLHWLQMAQDHLSDITVRVLARHYRSLSFSKGFDANTLNTMKPYTDKTGTHPLGIFVWGDTAATPHVNIWQGLRQDAFGKFLSCGAQIGVWY